MWFGQKKKKWIWVSDLNGVNWRQSWVSRGEEIPANYCWARNAEWTYLGNSVDEKLTGDNGLRSRMPNEHAFNSRQQRLSKAFY